MNTFRVKALTFGGEKQREGATSEFAVKCTQSSALLAVNTAANFNQRRAPGQFRLHRRQAQSVAN